MIYPGDYCLADSAAHGACTKPAGHDGAHRDANGYEWLVITPSPLMRAAILAAMGD